MSRPSAEFWQGQNILITGVCGTVGRELLRQIIAREPGRIIGLDNDESELFFLSEDHRRDQNFRFYLCDLRDRDELIRRMSQIDIVLHAAALKHVILCEDSPRDAVQTNILGTQNVIDAAKASGVSRVLFTSSDKAVNPTNVMGTSKLMGERLMTAANAHRQSTDPIFFSTRFGNVLGSRGSVIPLFNQQIRRGGPVTLTDPEMTRFIMTLEEAVSLVMSSVELAKGGEVFVTKMPAVRILDLAQTMIDLLAEISGHSAGEIKIETIGPKPGEKMYEELLNHEETRRALETDQFFVILPAFRDLHEFTEYEYAGAKSVGVEDAFVSATQEPMSKGELRDYLIQHGIVEEYR